MLFDPIIPSLENKQAERDLCIKIPKQQIRDNLEIHSMCDHRKLRKSLGSAFRLNAVHGR